MAAIPSDATELTPSAAEIPPSVAGSAPGVAELARASDGIARGAAEVTADGPRRPIVLNTRPRDQAGELSRLLRAAGYGVLEVPAIEIVPAWDADERAHVAGRLQAGAYAWVVLSSQNAGQALFEAVGPETLARARVLCGTATARALGLTDAVTLPRFSAAAARDTLRALLAAPGSAGTAPATATPAVVAPSVAANAAASVAAAPAGPAPAAARRTDLAPTARPSRAAAAPLAVAPSAAPAEPQPDTAPQTVDLAPVRTPPAGRPAPRVLVPRAAEGREELLDGLHALGVAVDAPIAYRTVAVPPDRLRASRPGAAVDHGRAVGPADLGVEAIALCSPSAVGALVAAWPASTLNGAATVCLGETTAAAARGAGLHVRAVATRTSMADLVAAIQSVVAVPAPDSPDAVAAAAGQA